jgi:hypothetical protein
MKLIKTVYPRTVPALNYIEARPLIQNRAYLLIANIGLSTDGNLWLGYEQIPAANRGFKIEPNNGVWEEGTDIGGVSIQTIYLYNDNVTDIIAIVIEGIEYKY